MKQNHIIILLGIIGFIIYVVMLWFRPQISWCDDTFFVDWARQMAINGQFESKPWPGSVPDYVPLYPVLLAGWIKLLGFSYFKVHLLDIFLAFINHCLLLNILVNRNIIKKSITIVGISICIWFGHTMFWINNAGRPEVLTLTMTIIAANYLIELYNNKTRVNIIKFFISSMFVLFSGVQGFVTLTFLTLILLLQDYKKSLLKRKHIIVTLIVSSLSSLSITCLFFYFNGALKSFLSKTILYSKTASYLWYIVKSTVLHQETELPSENNTGLLDRFVELTLNPEYCAMAVILLLLLFLYRKRLSSCQLNHSERTIIISALVLPLFYELAGRYPIYYTDFAYYLVVISIYLLFERLIQPSYLNRMVIITGFVIILNFLFSPPVEKAADFRIVDLDHNFDKKVLNDIKNSGISFDQPVVIPNEWYYMLVEKYEENMYYQSSVNYPSNLEFVVEIPSHEYINEGWDSKFNREMIRNNGYLNIYKVYKKESIKN